VPSPRQVTGLRLMKKPRWLRTCLTAAVYMWRMWSRAWLLSAAGFAALGAHDADRFWHLIGLREVTSVSTAMSSPRVL